MSRVALALFLLFLLLVILRALRLFLAGLAGARSVRARPAAVEQEMVRDPVCGTWVDRRIAIAGRRGAERVPVCSESCRARLESEASSP